MNLSNFKQDINKLMDINKNVTANTTTVTTPVVTPIVGVNSPVDRTVRRHPLAKEHFLEGNRQRFTLILIICGAGVMMAQLFGKIDPTPYLTFLTFIGSFFLGGASVSAYMAANKVDTSRTISTTNTTSDVREEKHNSNLNTNLDEHVNIDVKENLNSFIFEEGVNTSEVKPFSQLAVE